MLQKLPRFVHPLAIRPANRSMASWHVSCLGSFGMNPKADELKERTARFAEEVIRLVRQLPNTGEARQIGTQLIDSATSVASNYRATCRARSHADFVSKIGIVEEEADECEGWLLLLVRCEVVARSLVESLLTEARELVRIFAASHKTAKERQRHQRMR